MTSELINILRLIRSNNIGPITFYKLIETFGNATEAIKHIPNMVKTGGKRSFKLYPEKDAKEEIALAEKKGISIISYQDECYPKLLKQIADAPPILFALGNKELLNQKIISIVGTRNASINGRKFSSKIAYDLSEQGYIIASGMAKGIDASSHKGAMFANSEAGKTIAVLGTGVDIPYPTENEDLYEEIKRNGIIISEFPIGTTPQPQNFPRRNRIISGISKGIIVVEANTKSGSLITARMALEQGRDVFAVPGSPTDNRCAGPNLLIKQGAYLIENEFDILNVIDKDDSFELSENNRVGNFEHKKLEIDNNNIEKARKIILDSLNNSEVSLDEIVRETELPISTINYILLELELAGRLERTHGNKITLIT